MKPSKTFKKSILCSALISALSASNAASITVDNNCNLIDAISAANTDSAVGSCTAGSGADVIQLLVEDSIFNINGPLVPPLGPIEGGGGGGVNALPVITTEMTIEGNGLTINAASANDPVRIFTVETGGDLTLKDTTVTGANAGQRVASGLANYSGRVTLENTTFANNNGGVALYGGIGHVINNSVIRHNTATGTFGFDRGGFGSYYGLAAGLAISYASATISNSAVIENEIIRTQYIPLRGGGGGGGYSPAGGVGVRQSEVDIIDTTISGNRSSYGAGLVISGNGGFAARGELFDNNVTITNSTITDNEASYIGGLLNQDEYATLTIQGSIIAGNKENYIFSFAPNIYSEMLATINLDANNIIGDNGSAGSVGITLGSSDASFINDTADNLYPLTLTQGQLLHPLKVNSAAIDNNDLTCYGSITDQSSKGRGIDGDGNGSFICDIGASEHSMPIVVNNAPCNLQNAILSANNDASVGGCQPGNFHDIIQMPSNSTVSLTTVADDYADSFYFGLPGVNSAITIEGNNSTIERDAAAAEAFDVFLVNADAQLNLLDSTVTGANGNLGAVTTLQGNVNILNSNVIDNQSLGLFDFFSINSSVISSTINNNSPTSPYSYGSNFGTGMITNASSGFELSHSTVSNNSGFIGGVDFRETQLSKVSNSSISGNSGAVGGLVSLNDQYLQISGLTITNNDGFYAGGIYADVPDTGAQTISNSIVSGNVLTPPPTDRLNMPLISSNNPQLGRGGVSGTSEIYSYGNSVLLLGFNVIGQNGDSGTVGVTLNSNVIIPKGSADDVIEDTLADNGGTTLTHSPVADGDAVDSGGVFCGLSEDQLGRIRPWDGDGDGDDACDVGAVELGSVTSSDLIFKDGFDPNIFFRRTPKN